MTEKEERALIARTYDEVVREGKIEDQLKRLESMPDVLERYDALCNRVTRMYMYVRFIENENYCSDEWKQEPSRVRKAFRILGEEMRAAEEDIEDSPA